MDVFGSWKTLCREHSGWQGMPDLSEVQKEQAILSRFHSPFVVSVFEYAVGPNNSVMLLMERADIGLAEMLHTWKETGV